jgi:apolipoprotein N-acyltransferase
MPLRTSLTPAVLVAPWLDRGLTLLAVLACGLALLGARVRRRPLEPVGPSRVPTPTNGRDLT